TEVREILVLVRAVTRIVPADIVEELVAGGELHLAQALVRLDASGELDLVAVRVIAPAAARVETDDPATLAQRPDLLRESTERATRELVARGDIHVAPLRPPLLPQLCELVRGQSFRALEFGAVANHVGLTP